MCSTPPPRYRGQMASTSEQLRSDRLAVASLTGLAARFVGGFGEQSRDAALRLQAYLEAGRDPHGIVAAAVAALHEISTDPHLLTEAAAMYSPAGNGYVYGPAALRLLKAAGADLDEAVKVKAGRGNGWVTPQAQPSWGTTAAK